MPGRLTWKEFLTVEKLDRLGKDLKYGAVDFDHEKCTGCGLCEKACFTGIIKETKTKKPKILKHMGALCVSCGACTAICPEEAIEIVDFIEFYRYFRWLDRDKPQPPRRL